MIKISEVRLKIVAMNFTDLVVWKKARALRNRIFILIEKFPSSEKFALRDQVIRASRSITSNIAEGHGHYHHKENIRHCRMARASLSETLDHLICAYDCQLMNKSDLEELSDRIEEVERILNGYIAHLKSKTS